MLKLILLISTLVVVSFSEEAEETLSRERRFAPFGFGFPFTYAGPNGAYAGAGAGPFAYAPQPWGYQPRSYYPFNWFPFPPMFPFPQNWYEGENVCKEVKTKNDDTPDDFSVWLKGDDSPNVNSDYSHEQESCSGSNTQYTCLKRITDGSGKSKLQGTKYQCCHGFVRNPNGPGCIENAPRQSPPAAPEAPAKQNDKYYYGFGPKDKYSQKSFSSSSSSSSSSNSAGKSVDVGKVPVR